MFIFLLSVKGLSLAWLDSKNPYSALSIEIKTENDVVEAGKPLNGKVIIENKYPAKLSGVFNIALMHHGATTSEFTTAIKTILTPTPAPTVNVGAGIGVPTPRRGRRSSERIDAMAVRPWSVTGKTEFSFKSFGIPEFSREPDAEGTWNIRIRQQNLDASFGAEAAVFIASSQKDPNN